jgi:PhnB protein
MKLNPYLNFDGTCAEAMTFYHQCLGGELSLQTAAQSGAAEHIAPQYLEHIIHADLAGEGWALMASDTLGQSTLVQGNNNYISFQCDSVEEIDRLFAALSDGGQITMPLGDTFWNARFGMFVDRFGICWMLNHNYPG